MVDVHTPEQRSYNMSRIRGHNTQPEKILRSLLHRKGFRFRIHYSKLPGKPDIVLPKYRSVIFVHGCFWHHHPGCKYAYIPQTRTDFWSKKLGRNVERDKENISLLKKSDWHPIIAWECELKKDPEAVLARISAILCSQLKPTYRKQQAP